MTRRILAALPLAVGLIFAGSAHVDLYSNGGNAPGDYGVVVWADGAEGKTSEGASP